MGEMASSDGLRSRKPKPDTDTAEAALLDLKGSKGMPAAAPAVDTSPAVSSVRVSACWRTTAAPRAKRR